MERNLAFPFPHPNSGMSAERNESGNTVTHVASLMRIIIFFFFFVFTLRIGLPAADPKPFVPNARDCGCNYGDQDIKTMKDSSLPSGQGVLGTYDVRSRWLRLIVPRC